MKNKRYMTLLEVLIALTLVSTLLVALFSIYRYIDDINRRTEESEKISFQSLYVQSRLSQIFCQASSRPKDKLEAKYFYFYTDNDDKNHSPYLVFIYNNRAAVPPIFSNEVLAKIYLDEGRLCLTTWPSPSHLIGKVAPVRNEILMENIQSLRFSFYLPPRSNSGDLPIDPISDDYYGKWNDNWPVKISDLMQADDLPAMIKIYFTPIDKKNPRQKEITLTFLLPHTPNHIIYHK